MTSYLLSKALKYLARAVDKTFRMATHFEKIVFGLLGGLTAIVVGLAVFGDFQKVKSRTPASVEEQVHTPYVYFFD